MYPAHFNDLRMRSDPRIINAVREWNDNNPNDQFGEIIEIPDQLADTWFIIRESNEHCDPIQEIGENAHHRHYEDVAFNIDKLNAFFRSD